MNLNSQILNENYDSTFHIIRDNGEDYEEFLDLFIGSPLLVGMAHGYEVLKSYLDSIQPTQYHSVIQILLNIDESTVKDPSNSPNQKKFL